MGRPSFRACQSDRSARRRRDNILARHQNSQRRLEPTGQLLPRPATAAGNTLGVRSQRRTRTKQSFESDQRSHGGRALVPTGLMGTASRKPIQLSRGRAATPPMDLVYEEANLDKATGTWRGWYLPARERWQFDSTTYATPVQPFGSHKASTHA